MRGSLLPLARRPHHVRHMTRSRVCVVAWHSVGGCERGDGRAGDYESVLRVLGVTVVCVCVCVCVFVCVCLCVLLLAVMCVTVVCMCCSDVS